MLEKIVTMLKDAFSDWNFWVAIITAGTALLALFQTRYQIKLSNKQHLFDRRISNYTLVTGLVCLFQESQILSGRQRDDKWAFRAFSDLVTLLDHSFFGDAISEVSNGVDSGNFNILYQKRNELLIVATEATVLYGDKDGKLIEVFIKEYENLLRYLFLYNHYAAQEVQEKGVENVADDLFSPHNEQEYVQELENAYQSITDAYQALIRSDVLAKVKKQIQLK